MSAMTRAMLPLRPDMASLSVGSNNFPTRVYENPPDLVDWLAAEMLAHDVKPEIEAFDLSHILKAHGMWKAGQIKDRPYVQFVMGVKNAMPADREVFDYYIHTVKRLFGEDVPWCAAGIGPNQIVLNEWAIGAGGHARTGLEDNVRLDRDRRHAAHRGRRGPAAGAADSGAADAAGGVKDGEGPGCRLAMQRRVGRLRRIDRADLMPRSVELRRIRRQTGRLG